MSPIKFASALFLGLSLCSPYLSAKTPEGKPLVVLIAGRPSHGPGEHEHNAGVQLLAKCLAQGAPQVAVKVQLNAEWPDATTLAQADSILIYSDGGGGHPAVQGDHLATLRKEMERGCGFVCLHYAVEVEKERGGSEFLDWLGGYFEKNWSVNPHWTADYKSYPKHPVASGVKPFSSKDEWYYHMRFRDGMKGVTPVLSDVPPESTVGKDGSHSGNPAVRAEVAAKTPQHTAWVAERPNSGRGFGFTGGHFHKGWANDDQRKLVLNAILWTAKADVPASGVESKLAPGDIEANLDVKGQKKPAAAVNSNAKPLAQTELVKGTPVPIKAELKGAKELFLVVTDGGDGFMADWANWIEPVLVKADGSKVKLTDLKPKVAEVGWGKLGVNKNANGDDMKVGGKPVAFGFGTHAPALIGFDLPEGIVGFEAQGAVDNGGTDQGSGSTVIYKVFAQNPGATAKATPAIGSGPDRVGLAKAKESMKTFKTAEGLSVNLFAAEPMIVNPTNIDIDHRGRVWGVECVNYRRYGKMRPEGDRVVIVEDKNGDGEADDSKTFFQSPELTNPLGICVLPQAVGTKVIVSAAPNVWLLTDKDGDDKADDAVKIFKTTGVWDYDHQVHAFVFGPDGKFYFNFGDAATSLTWPDGTVVKDLAGNEISNKGKPYRKGMVLRCDIDLETAKVSNIETLGWNFRNNYEVCVDSFGTMWQSDNDDDGNKAVRINYVMDYGNFGFSDEVTGSAWQAKRPNLEAEIPQRHWHQSDPGVVPNLLITGAGSPTGILINEGEALGDVFKNQLIHGDAGPRSTRAYPVQKDGAGYIATTVDVLTSTDSWYRVSDLNIAPDGALFVADWYDPGVGGHAMGDHEPGQMMGRVYRVAKAAPTVPKVDVSTPAGAAVALQSPNLATRSLAWRALNKSGAAAESELAKLWQSNNPRLRARALGVLAQIPGKEISYLKAGLGDTDSDVRCFAIRLTRMLSTTKGLDISALHEDATLVRKLVTDSSAQVRREIILSLHGGDNIEGLWAAMAAQFDGKDRWYLEALGIGARGNDEACLNAWLGMVGEKWNTPAGREIIWRLRARKSATYLAKLLSGTDLPATDQPRFIRAFDFLANSPERTKALVEIATSGKAPESIAREALVRLKGTDLNAEPSVKEALATAVDRAKGKPEFIDLVRDFGLKGQTAALLDTAVKISGDPSAADAVRMILDDPEGEKVISAALATPKSGDVLKVLGTTGTTRGLARLVSLVKADAEKAETRQEAVRALARTQAGAEELLKIQPFPDHLKLTAASALALVQYAKLKDQIAQAFPMPNTLGGKPLPPMSELVKLKGDLGKGKVIAERLESSCVTCHRIGDKGADFGPALTEIGGKLPKEALFESIINPNSGVSMGFETWQLTLKDGGVAMGLIRSETPEDVVVALPGGASIKIPRSNIAKREKLANSMMPSGLNQALSQDDLVDLVEYLASLKAK